MKTIIAGSRKLTSFVLLTEAIEASGFDITEVVSSQGNLKLKSTMTTEILTKLRNAIRLSPMVSQEDKGMLA
jgi:hypothetical protein